MMYLCVCLQWKHILNTNPEAYWKPQISRPWWEVPEEESWDGDRLRSICMFKT